MMVKTSWTPITRYMKNVDGTGAVQTVANFKAAAADAGPTWLLLDTRKPLKPFIFQERTKPEFVSKTDPKSSDKVFDSDTFEYGIRYRCAAGCGFWQMAYGSTEPLTAETFDAARTAMRKFTADGGRPLGIRPDVIVVPPDLESTAETLFEPRPCRAALIHTTKRSGLYPLAGCEVSHDDFRHSR